MVGPPVFHAAEPEQEPVPSGPIPGPQPGFPEFHQAPPPQPNVQVHQEPQRQFHQQGFPQGPGGPPVGPFGVPTPVQAPQIPRPSFNVPWTTGLFDCFDDPTNALITFCVPCVTFGQVAEIIDQGHTSCSTQGAMYSCVWFLICCPCLLSFSYRTKLRARYELMETPAPDWLTHLVCELCALCQMHRELVNRGLDPSIGWLGNVQKMQQQQQMPPMAPPMQQTMM